MSIDRRVFNCRGPQGPGVHFGYQCPERWDALTSTDDPYKRHCGVCDRAVFRVINIIDAKLRVSQGECIAVPAWVAAQAVREEEELYAVMGMPIEPVRPYRPERRPYAEHLERAIRRGPPR